VNAGHGFLSYKGLYVSTKCNHGHLYKNGVREFNICQHVILEVLDEQNHDLHEAAHDAEQHPDELHDAVTVSR
jgi:hypothetical protein